MLVYSDYCEYFSMGFHSMTQHAAAAAMMRHSQPPAGAAARKYLVLFHTVSCGQNGPGLGSDEQDIVLIVYLVVDLQGNKVLDVKRICVRPEPLDVNDNILSDEMRTEYKISPQEIKSAPTLNQVIHDLSCTWRDSIPGSYSLVTDGQLTLRQSLFPEAFRKNITLPSCFHSFHDLRKEFVSVVNCSVHQDTLTVENMATMLGIPLPNAQDSAIRTVEAMASILERLSADGLNLHQPEFISTHLLQGIRSKGEKVDGNCVVRARGLPWQASDTDIAHFFLGLNIAPGGVALCLSSQGRRNGEALVLFDSVAHRDMALKRHKHHIGNRYIEVYKASGEDFIEVAGGNNTEAQEFLSRGGKVIIRMRGLPYDCTQKQVIDFFKSGSKNCEVLDSEQGVLFVKKLDGRSTGDAFVLFGDEKDAEKALSKHKELIGTRYIELFRSTTAEVQQVLNRTIEQHPHNKNNPNQNNSMAHKLINGGGMHGGVQAAGGLAQGALHGALQPQVPLIPQQLITAGVKKDCIRLRGLPYEAQVEHILEFLGEHSRNIVVQGVHMVFNAQGQPSGEAFIQMDTEHSAHSAHTNKHNRYMTIGKKQRYIEVLQCSGEDMSLVLTGGLAALHSPANPNALGAPKLPLLPPSATPMLPLNNAAALHHHHQQQQAAAAAAAAAAADPLQHLNPALLMSNMYLVPPPAATHHIPTSTFDLQLLAAASQAGAGQVFMLPPTHQRLFAAHGAAAQHHGFPGAQMGHPQSQFLLQPPPQLRAGLQLSFPPPTAVTAAVTSLAQQPSKRTHDQAFTSPTELLPTKRPPVVYTSEAGGVVGGCSTAAAPVLALPQIQSNFT